MTTWQALALGILQGLTEFLPVSSSGHLVLGETVMGLPSTGLLLEILLHCGTLLAVLLVFWRDILEMFLHPVKNPLLRLLVIATLPAVFATLLLGDRLDLIFQGWFLGFAFLVTGCLLLLGEWLGKRAPRHTEEVGVRHALTMGVLQAVAILPGVSRSGSTIVGGLASGLTREAAARFSFLMSAVATLGSLVFKLKDLLEAGSGAFAGTGWMVPLVGVLAAAITGYLAIRWMLGLVRRVSLKGFAIYVFALGALVLADQLFFGIFFQKII